MAISPLRHFHRDSVMSISAFTSLFVMQSGDALSLSFAARGSRQHVCPVCSHGTIQTADRKEKKTGWKTVVLVPGRLTVPAVWTQMFLWIFLSNFHCYLYWCILMILLFMLQHAHTAFICTLIIMVKGQRVTFIQHEMLPTRETQGNIPDTCGFHFLCFFLWGICKRSELKVRTQREWLN